MTITGLPAVVTDWPNPPTATVHLTNMYPGHVTWVKLTDADGKTWMSPKAIGVSSADIPVDLSIALANMRRTSNTVRVEVFSDNAVAAWQAAAISGSSDGTGREQLLSVVTTFNVNVSGTLNLNVNTL